MRQHLYVAEIGQDPGEFDLDDFDFDESGLLDYGGGGAGGGDFDLGLGDYGGGDFGGGNFPTGDLSGGGGFASSPGQVVTNADGYAIGHLAADGVTVIPLTQQDVSIGGEFSEPGDTGGGAAGGSWFDPFGGALKKLGTGLVGSIPGIVTGIVAGQHVTVGGKTYTTTADGKIVATTGTGTGGGGGHGTGAGGGGGGGGSGANKGGVSPMVLLGIAAIAFLALKKR